MEVMKRCLLIIFILAATLYGFAQEVSFTAAATPKVGMGQNFQVQYTLNKQGSNLKLGSYPDFKLVGGPSTSTSQNIQIINGQTTQKYSYTYTYVFQPKSVGKYTIAGATVTVDGKQYTSNSVTIEVQKDPVQTNSGRRQSYDPFADFYNQTQPAATTTPKEVTGEDLFIRVVTDKTNVYKGEPISAALKVYTKVNLSGINEITFPDFDSFYAEELEAATQLNFSKETYNGQTYNVALIKRYLLYPRYSGNIVIESCEAECEVRQQVSGGNNFYSNFFGYYDNVTKTVKSPEVNINVKNLPPASESFSGAIGSFSIKITQSEDTANVNDAVTFKLTLTGTGNFNMIETPEIIWPKEFEVYEPLTTENTDVSTAGVNGSKTWEYTVIPRYAGIFRLGKINFQYFELASKQYKTISTSDITLAVRKDANDKNFGETDYNYSQKNVEYIGDEDIRFVRNRDMHLVKDYKPLVRKGYYYLLFILPLIIFVSISVVLRKKIKENANYALMKVKHAGKTSRKRLKLAKKFMLLKNKPEFYKEIISALWGYAGDRFRVPVSDLTKDRIISVFAENNIEEEMTNKLIKLIEKCEFAHFAPASPETEFEYIYTEAVEIIEQLEQKIR